MGAYTQVAFETDIMLDLKSEEHAYQIFFSAKERKGYAYMLQFRKSGNTIVLTDNSNTSNKDGNTATLASNLKNGEWFNLRVEYYKSAVANDIRIKIYINGSLAAISDNYYGSENAAKTPATLIEEVCFYSFGATQGTLYFDNVSLTGSNATCNEDVTVSKK